MQATKLCFALLYPLSALGLQAIASCSDDDSDDGGPATGGTSGNGGTGGSGATGGTGATGGAGATGGSSGSGGSAGAGATDAGSSCEALVTACAPYDLGAGATHDCHGVGKAGDESACSAELGSCQTSCTSGELSVKVQFAGRVGTAPFACGQSYANVGTPPADVSPTDFRMYVSNVRLTAENGDEVPVTLDQDGVWQYENVALVDFEDGSAGCSNGTTQTNTVITGKVPFGKYAGIDLTIGVPTELNHTDVATAPSPLNVSGLFWGWNIGRLFLAVTTSTQVTSDGGTGDGGATTFDQVLHVGTTGCTGEPAEGGTAVCTNSNRAQIELTGFLPGSNVIVADVAALLAKTNAAADQCHSFTADTCTGPYEQLGLDFATGSPSTTAQQFLKSE